jgi:Protein of unknown function (DUF3551)
MRTISAVVVTAAALMLPAPHGADARDYPWCATYNDETGARNCGFETREQCFATISGAGGICGENPAYRPGPADTRRGRTPSPRLR